MGRAVWLVVVVGARPVLADDGLAVRTRSELQEPGPRLTLDPMLRTQLQGLGTVEEGQTRRVSIGSLELELEGTRWDANDRRKAEPTMDLPSRGWRKALRISHDFGFVHVEGHVVRGHVDMHHGRGTHRDVGLSLSRKLRLSRWMTAWISLDVGLRRWEGDRPPAGESDDSTVMLRLGTTFR